MSNSLKISINSLIMGEGIPFDLMVSCDLLGIQELYLRFEKKIHVHGICTLQKEGLDLLFDVQTKASMPCKICNEWTFWPVSIKDISHFEKNEANCDNDFDFSNIVREHILLDTPKYIECGGKCEKREEINKYLKKEDHGSTTL